MFWMASQIPWNRWSCLMSIVSVPCVLLNFASKRRRCCWEVKQSVCGTQRQCKFIFLADNHKQVQNPVGRGFMDWWFSGLLLSSALWEKEKALCSSASQSMNGSSISKWSSLSGMYLMNTGILDLVYGVSSLYNALGNEVLVLCASI